MRQRLGQHFLKNKEILEKEVAVLNLKEGETVIEIGSGRGELTVELKNKSEKIKIIAIEKDPELVSGLQVLGFRGDVEIVCGDVLKVLPTITSNLQPLTYKIIGNIPYYLTGYLLRIIGELKNKPSVCVFIIQKEVAERIVAKPPKMNKLAASVQFWANPEIVRLVSRKDFSPSPEVESSLIKLTINNFQFSIKEEDYYKAVKVLFQQPRKTILNNLTADTNADSEKTRTITRIEIQNKLEEIGIRPDLRPQDLSVEDIVKIAKLF